MTLIEQTRIRVETLELKTMLDKKKKGRVSLIDRLELEYFKNVLDTLEEYEKMKEGKNNEI